MKVAIVILALCAVASYAQPMQNGQGPRGPPPCPTNLGVTQAQCDTMHTCMQNAMGSMPKPTAGAKPTDAQMAQMKQTMTNCANQAGISADIQAQLAASRPQGPPNGQQPQMQG
uniref:Uncharacterized protein n=1 Tax=Plectus sambesii TaxID=2011161 RepID=A0A914V197_9BILA